MFSVQNRILCGISLHKYILFGRRNVFAQESKQCFFLYILCDGVLNRDNTKGSIIIMNDNVI